MEDLSNQVADDVTVIVPDGLEGPREVTEWFTEKGVDVAKLFYFKTKIEGSENELKISKRFLGQVEQGFNEVELGSSPQVKRLRTSTMDIKENVQRINGHLTLSSEGRYRGTAPVDLGNDALNHLMALINQRFDNMERATAEKFDNMNQEIRYLVRQQNSSSARAENKFKGRGGEIESPSAYKDIANKDNKLPIDEGLERLHSMDQINSMTGPTVNNYLRFYDIATSGQVQERKKRLLQFVGVNVSTEVRETFGSGI